MQQAENDIWYKIRSYNCDMLLKLYNTLESTPEVNGSGSMMDHSLIVYTSNNGDKQHTRGEIWPVVLIGDAGGQFKTNYVTNLKDKRPLNDFYTTLLRAAGSQIDYFNLSEPMAKKTGSQSGR